MKKQILFYNLGDIENMSPEENNRLFVKLVDENMYKGQEEMDKWLNELACDYISRCGEDLDTAAKSICLKNWKDNTLFIIDNKNSYISQWCEKCRIEGERGKFRLTII